MGERIDYARLSGTSSTNGLGYITVAPLPATLYTETQGGAQVSWTSYDVTITVDGTPITLHFDADDTEAKVIENVPTGAALTACAEIGLSDGACGTTGAGTPLLAEAAPTTAKTGSNTITMYARYRVEFDGANSPAAVPAAATYTNGGANPALPLCDSPAGSGSDAKLFCGWSLGGGTADFAPGAAIPAGSCKGLLSLRPVYWNGYSISVSPPANATLSGGTYALGSLTGAFTLSAAVGAGAIPAGVSFAWTITANGTTRTKTGASCTVSAAELGFTAGNLGDSADTAGSIAVTCTATTSAGSGGISKDTSISVCRAALPGFHISVTPPSSYSATESTAGSCYALANLTDTFTFTAEAESGSALLPGTVFSWTVTDANGGTKTLTGESVTVSPGALSTGTQSPGVGWTVTCTASHPNVAEPRGADEAKSFSVYKITIPPLTLSVTKPSTAEGTASPYKLANATDAFTFTANPASGYILPSGITFTWEIKAGSGSWTTLPGTDQSIDIAPSSFGSIGIGSASATACEVRVTASHPSLPASEGKTKSRGFSMYRLFPDFTVAISSSDLPSRSGGTDADGNPVTIFTVKDTDISGGKTLTFKAEPEAGASFPAGTTFEWKVGTTGLPAAMNTATVSPSLTQAGVTTIGAAAVSPTPTEYTVSCTAKNGTSKSDAVTKTLRISPPVKLGSPSQNGDPTVAGNASFVEKRGSRYSFQGDGSGGKDIRFTFTWSAPANLPAGVNVSYRVTSNWGMDKTVSKTSFTAQYFSSKGTPNGEDGNLNTNSWQCTMTITVVAVPDDPAYGESNSLTFNIFLLQP